MASAPTSDNDAPSPRLPQISPDVVEHTLGDEIDNSVPSYGYQEMPMVGIGGSAGSLPALQRFFAATPADTGCVFVVVVHLSPKHESALADVLSRHTTMRVLTAEGGQPVRANHVYVIPPAKHLVVVDSYLRLTDLDPVQGRRVAVDLFFRSLADSHGPHAAAIVVSGADGDGALGIKRVKERGGLTIAQDPEEAEHSSMPRSAIDTGMVDWVLRAGEIPARLHAYFDQEKAIKLPSEDGPLPAQPPKGSADLAEQALREVLLYLRTRTGRDFSYYKRATIVRRIGRRMQVNGLADVSGYLNFLRSQPGEAGALLHDLLISVTNFFRDRDAFDVLRQHIPNLFANKGPNDTVRVWVPACATGEEAYSVAMLLTEHARKLEGPPALQVFACDLDESAIQQARTGLYTEAITADISEDRLRVFFTKDHRGYRVSRELREMVLFAAHDLLKDAPFSRMDLVSCRNLLIYLNRDAQKRALDTFHFALRPTGILFLGTSESVPDESALFRILDKKSRLYAHQPDAHPSLPIPSGPGTLQRVLEANDRANPAPVVHGRDFAERSTPVQKLYPSGTVDRAALTDLHYRLIERFAPPSVVVNADHQILHLSESAGRFLRFAGGAPSADLLRAVHPALRAELRAALFRAAESMAPVQVSNIPVPIGEHAINVDLRVAPAQDLAPGYFLISLEARESDDALPAIRPEPDSALTESVVTQLEREVEQLKADLRDTAEQHEAGTEEMKASNEELQAMNEELRSASEELETSREELQSINEELTTVNGEMKAKVDELAQSNSDLQNLMASTAIPTIFLDRELALTRYTPNAVELFYIIATDVGRPIAHLRHRVQYPEIVADAERVLSTLVPVEREVRGEAHCYIARIQPYRTLEDHIGGVILTFVDITERQRVMEALRVSDERMHLVVESAKDYAIFTTDMERRVTAWNAGAQAMLGYADNEIMGQSADVIFAPEDRESGDPEGETAAAGGAGMAVSERWLIRKDGSRVYCSGTARPLRNSNGVLVGLVKIMRDLTEAKRRDQELREREEQFRRAIEDAPIPVIMHAEDGQVLLVSRTWTDLTGYGPSDIPTFDAWLNQAYGYGADKVRTKMQAIFQGLASSARLEIQVATRSGETRHWIFHVSAPGTLGDGRRFAVGMVVDVTEQSRAEAALRESEERLRQADLQKNRFLATLGHELRNPLAAIRGGVEILQSEKSKPATRAKTLPQVAEQVTHVERLVDDLLDVARIVEGKLRVRLEPMPVQRAVTDALEMVRLQAEAAGLELRVALPADPLTVMGDRVRLTQVFVNLLTNAFKYAGQARRVDVTVAAEPAMARISVRDYGAGIAADVLPRIFEPFVQAKTGSASEGGLGLGLAVVRQLVTLHGGTISAASGGQLQGAEFVIHLPIAASG